MAGKTSGAAPAGTWRDPGARPHLQLTDIVKTFGSTRAVDGVSLDIFPGEFFALLGPSGCGKTTLLRMLAGFETPDSGHILLDGEDLTAIPPHERPVNMMFQSYALFPHMNVAENIGFGLQMQRMPKRDIKARVEEMLALVHLDHLARRKPDQLSGGQKQRVALARALAKKPKLLLLDEPLGALDRKLREATQFELVNIQESLGLTFVIVTHDQEEAMTVSTRLAVMRDGQIAQLGEPHHVYEAPNSRYVAEFIGDVNILEGVVENAGSGAGSCIIRLADGGVAELGGARDLPAGAVALALRPEKIAIGRQEDSAVAAANTLDGAVEDIAYLGDMSVYNIRLDSGALVRVARTNRFRALEEPISWEDRVRLSWDGSALVVLAGG
jgi:putrescine transport system ATP-binding protein